MKWKLFFSFFILMNTILFVVIFSQNEEFSMNMGYGVMIFINFLVSLLAALADKLFPNLKE